MKSSECRDKQIMELSGSKNKPSFNFFNPDEESEEEFDDDDRGYGFRPGPPLGASQAHPSVVRNCSSTDRIDSVNVTRDKVGMELVSQINQTIKEHFDNLLHSVDGLSARLSQLESKTRQLENAVDDLKVSAEYNNGRTDGKLRQLENILREVQDGIHFLRDRQEIAETQLQLAKLQGSKSSQQSEDQKTAPVQADSALRASSSASEQSPQPLLTSGALSLPLPTLHPDAPSTLLYQNGTPAGGPVATQLHTQVAQNPIPSSPPSQSYYLPTGNTLETTYQQYNVPPTQQAPPPPPIPSQLYQSASNLPQVSQSPLGSVTSQTQPPWMTSLPPVPSQLYQPASNLPQVSQSPELPQLHPPLGSVIPQTQPPWIHHPEETPPMQSHNYQPSILQSSSQPPGGPPMQQFYMDSSQRMHEPPLRRPYSELPADYSQPPGSANFSNMHHYSGSPSHYSNSTMKPSQLSPSSPVMGGGSNYTPLPKAQILPHALPTASSVDAGSSTGRTGNKVSVDDVVDKVTAMGFRRDLARATVRKLTENGQTVDLNAVLDKLMNNDGDGQPQNGWIGR